VAAYTSTHAHCRFFPLHRYTQLLPLHQIWQSYVFTQLNNALSLSVQPGQQQQPSQAQKRQKHDLSQAAQQQQQQQQLASKLTTNTTPSQPASNLQQAPPLCTSSAQKLLPVQVAAVRMQLSRCELHCSILQVGRPQLARCLYTFKYAQTHAHTNTHAHTHAHTHTHTHTDTHTHTEARMCVSVQTCRPYNCYCRNKLESADLALGQQHPKAQWPYKLCSKYSNTNKKHSLHMKQLGFIRLVHKNG